MNVSRGNAFYTRAGAIEDKKMVEVKEISCEEVQAVVTPKRKSTAGNKAAKFCIIMAVSAVVLHVAADTILGEPAASAATFLARTAVWYGAATGWAVLIWVCFARRKDTLILAATGLLMNLGLLITGFGGPPMLGRQCGEQQEISDEQIDTQTISKSGRTMVTKDWTAGYVGELTDRNFDDVVGGADTPVLVDFWAPWCGPCRRQSPIIGQVALEYEGKLKVCKLNIDVGVKSADKFGANRIPTIILFDKGRIKKRWVGVTDRSAICLEINKLIKK